MGINCAFAVDTVLISNMAFTNKFQEEYGFTSTQWASTPVTRVYISFMMYLDFAMDNHSSASFDDVAYLDTSYFVEHDGMITVIFRGRNYLDGYSLMLMYTPADRDGAYSIFSDDEFGNFAMLKAALVENYGNVIENDLTAMVELSNSMGFNYYADDDEITATASDSSSPTYNGPSSDVGDGYSCGLLAFKENGKWGYLDKEGNIVIPPQWDDADDFDEGFASVFIGTFDEKGWPDSGMHGVINTNGEYVIPLMECESISVYDPLENGFSITYETRSGDSEYAYYRTDGTQIGNWRWENCYDPNGDDYICACLNGKWGYVDRNSGEVVIDYQFDVAEPFHGNLACVGMKKNLKITSFYIDRSGETAIENAGWDYADSFIDGSEVTSVFKGTTKYDGELPDEGRYALIDRSGNLLCGYIWDNINISDNGLIIAGQEKNGRTKYGVINKNMETIVEPEWDYIGGYYYGYAEVFKGTINKYGSPEEGVHGFIDANGKMICDLIWTDAFQFHPDGFAVVAKQNSNEELKYGVIDSNGRTVVPPEYDDIVGHGYIYSLFHDGLSLVIVNEKYGYINEDGELIIDAIWDKAEQFSEGIAVVWKDDNWTIIDTQGNAIR